LPWSNTLRKTSFIFIAVKFPECFDNFSGGFMRFIFILLLQLFTMNAFAKTPAEVCDATWVQQGAQLRQAIVNRISYEIRRSLKASYKAAGVSIADSDIVFQVSVNIKDQSLEDAQETKEARFLFSSIHVNAGTLSRDFEIRPAGNLGGQLEYFTYIQSHNSSVLYSSIGDFIGYECNTSTGWSAVGMAVISQQGQTAPIIAGVSLPAPGGLSDDVRF
jgi:hypothetical protein